MRALSGFTMVLLALAFVGLLLTGSSGCKGCGEDEVAEEEAKEAISYTSTGVIGAGAQRWRKKMTPAEIRTVQLCCGKTAREFGYEALSERASPFALILPWLSLPWVSVRVVWINRARLGRTIVYIRRRLHALVWG